MIRARRVTRMSEVTEEIYEKEERETRECINLPRASGGNEKRAGPVAADARRAREGMQRPAVAAAEPPRDLGGS